jgi:cell division protein FtsI (penicillin-binding protein 3)
MIRETGGYADDEYLAVFTGFAPADDPRVAIAVMVERPNPEIGYYGGTVAAPIFAAIARHALELDGIDVPDEWPSIAVEHAASAEVTEGVEALDPHGVVGPREVPDFDGMLVYEALQMAGRRGLAVTVEGAGRVAEQDPPPHAPAAPGMTVRLMLEGALR